MNFYSVLYYNEYSPLKYLGGNSTLTRTVSSIKLQFTPVKEDALLLGSQLTNARIVLFQIHETPSMG